MKYGRRICFADGTKIEDGQCGYSAGNLWCYVNGKTFMELAQIFTDATKTSLIKFEYGDMTDTYENFTNCNTIIVDEYGQGSVMLQKAGAANGTA